MTLPWLVVSLAVVLIGVTKSGFGGGIGLTIVPMTALAMGRIPGRGAEAAIGLLLPLLVCGDIVAVYQYRRLFSIRHVKSLFPGTVAGIVVGGILLWFFNRQTRLIGALVLIIVGAECIALVGIQWWLTYRTERKHLLPEPLRSLVTGTYAGISSTLAHAAGPIITMYLLPLKLDRKLFVGTCAVYFLLLNTAKLPAFYLSGIFEKAEVTFSLRFLPLVAVGAIFGVWINRRMTDRIFSKVTYAITFLLGWYVLADGILRLVRG